MTIALRLPGIFYTVDMNLLQKQPNFVIYTLQFNMYIFVQSESSLQFSTPQKAVLTSGGTRVFICVIIPIGRHVLALGQIE